MDINCYIIFYVWLFLFILIIVISIFFIFIKKCENSVWISFFKIMTIIFIVLLFSIAVNCFGENIDNT